jgi:hypothetical protein
MQVYKNRLNYLAEELSIFLPISEYFSALLTKKDNSIANITLAMGLKITIAED